MTMAAFMKEKCVLLYSGGMDSMLSFEILRKYYKKVILLYINYGGTYCDKEESFLRYYLEDNRIKYSNMQLNIAEVGVNAYIPNRNIFLLTRASEYADTIYFGALKDDNVGDKTVQFAEAMSKTLTLSLGRKIKVDSLFWREEKATAINTYGIQRMNDGSSFLEVVESLVYRNVSCYDVEKVYCGKCPSCFRKYCALLINGIELPFYNEDLKKSYLQNIDKYFGFRKMSILASYNKVLPLVFSPLNTFNTFKVMDPKNYETYKVDYKERWSYERL